MIDEFTVFANYSFRHNGKKMRYLSINQKLITESWIVFPICFPDYLLQHEKNISAIQTLKQI